MQCLKAWVLAAWVASLSVILQGCIDNSSGKESGIAESERLGSFLVLGDWGWDAQVHGNLDSRSCQQAIADAMANKMKELGDVKFIINVGDSFYPDGVSNKGDPQWDTKWRNVYAPEVRSVPWYSIYGNHDYIKDPCICSQDLQSCAQVNSDEDNLDFFYMPNLSWFKEHLDLDTEVIAMDTNFLWLNHTCQLTACPQACARNLMKRGHDAFKLFYERAAMSNASNWLVFSHYPTDYFPRGPWSGNTQQWPNEWPPSWMDLSKPADAFPDGFGGFIDELSNASRSNIVYFGGHRHNVDQESTASTAPQSNWLVGGGGGWGTEAYGDQQGFVVGEIAPDKVVTYPVTVNFFEFCDDGRERPTSAPSSVQSACAFSVSALWAILTWVSF